MSVELRVGASGIGECIGWNTGRGYGFLAVAGRAVNLFIHSSELAGRELHVGARVRFQVGEDRNGRVCAINVALLVRDEAQKWTPNLTTRNTVEKDTSP